MKKNRIQTVVLACCMGLGLSSSAMAAESTREVLVRELHQMERLENLFHALLFTKGGAVFVDRCEFMGVVPLGSETFMIECWVPVQRKGLAVSGIEFPHMESYGSHRKALELVVPQAELEYRGFRPHRVCGADGCRLVQDAPIVDFIACDVLMGGSCGYMGWVEGEIKDGDVHAAFNKALARRYKETSYDREAAKEREARKRQEKASRLQTIINGLKDFVSK